MISRKKHITFLLLGLFIFPIVFQSLHIILHHAGDHSDEHHIGRIINASSTAHEFIVVTNHDHEKEVCVVCEYQFSTNQLPFISNYPKGFYVLVSTIHEKNQGDPYREIFSDKSPRAPPVLNS